MTATYTRIVSFVLFLSICSMCLGQVSNQTRITRPIDATQRVRVRVSDHPLARPESDEGTLNPNVEMQVVSLYLTRSSTQEDSLHKLLVEQQDPGSPLYHKWLTPEPCADRFGIAPNVVAQIKNWLGG